VTLAALLSLLVLAVPARADDSGGVAFQSFDEAGGGIVAPGLAPVLEPTPAQPPVAEAAQEETPTTPEGEEQPSGEENGDGDSAPDEPIDDRAAPPGDDGGAGGESAGGSLPQTGFELAALSAIGLGLLLAGAALWPTSSWPPQPRRRLSRSTPRR
jgi:LPXTG-motif cell wall-anchored protein